MTERSELWRFDLDSPQIRTLITYGGKLGFDSHFMPAARRRAEAEDLTIINVDPKSFRFDVKVNNTYAVIASVTVEDNKSTPE